MGNHRALGTIFSLLLLCSCATKPYPSANISATELPADVTMNKDAGRGGFLFVTLRLDDGEELPFIVDTGSPGSLISKSLEPKLGKRLGTWTLSKYGNQTSDRYMAPRLYLGNTLLMSGTNISTFDFTHLSSLSGHLIMGVLGVDCLRHYCIQLDFEAGTLRFLDSNKVDAARLGKAFPIIFSSIDPKESSDWHPYPVINHSSLSGGTRTKLLIDTGCNIDGLVPKDTTKRQATRLSELIWDGETYTNIHVGLEPVNALGLRFLARHLVTLDFPNRTMYLKKTSNGPLNMDEKKWPDTALEPTPAAP
jgi:hypothetical protein